MTERPEWLTSIQRYECQQCGNCCIGHSIAVTYEDIIRWDRETRWDILSEVRFVQNSMNQSLNWWYFQKTAGISTKCPFFTDDKDCSIHNTKPLMCRNFPLNTAHPDRLELCQGIRKGKRVRPNIFKKIRNKENAALQLTSEKYVEIDKIIGNAIDIVDSEK